MTYLQKLTNTQNFGLLLKYMYVLSPRCSASFDINQSIYLSIYESINQSNNKKSNTIKYVHKKIYKCDIPKDPSKTLICNFTNIMRII